VKALLRSLFLTRRFFAWGWAVAAGFVAAWFLPGLLPVANAALALLAVATALDLLRLYRTREGMAAERHTLAKWSNGDANPVSVRLRNRYPFAVYVRVLDELPAQLQERGLELRRRVAAGGHGAAGLHGAALDAGRACIRGHQRAGAHRAGLAERRYILGQGQEVAVYPSYLHLREYGLMAEADPWSATGHRKLRRVAQRSEFELIRDYIPGDDRRTVNWKAVARRGKWMVNQYQDEKAQSIVQLIDTGRTMKMPFGGLSLLDRSINAALMLASIALKKDDKAGLVTYSNKVHHLLPPARDKGRLQRVMELLYAQRTDFAETDMQALYGAVKRGLPQRCLLLTYTNFESLQAMHRQLPYLQLLARTHLVCVVLFRNTELDALLQRPDRH
jgi:uncharacterized protein (DUF58 family)